MCIGVRGWYPLLPLATPHIPPVSGPAPQGQRCPNPVVSCAYVGGVEVSAVFSSKRDKEMVMSSAEREGWESGTMLRPSPPGGGGATRQWEVTLEVGSVWLQQQSMLIRTAAGSGCSHMMCFVRYRFFDLGELLRQC